MSVTVKTNRQDLKAILKKVPGLVALKRGVVGTYHRIYDDLYDRLNIHKRRGNTKLDLMASFPLYQPCSAGTYKDRAYLTIQTIN